MTPRRPDYNRLYYKYTKEKYGARNGFELFAQLAQVISQYMELNEDASFAFQPYEVNEEGDEEVVTPFILVVVTEQMKRIHKLVSVSITNNCSFSLGSLIKRSR